MPEPMGLAGPWLSSARSNRRPRGSLWFLGGEDLARLETGGPGLSCGEACAVSALMRFRGVERVSFFLVTIDVTIYF